MLNSLARMESSALHLAQSEGVAPPRLTLERMPSICLAVLRTPGSVVSAFLVCWKTSSIDCVWVWNDFTVAFASFSWLVLRMVLLEIAELKLDWKRWLSSFRFFIVFSMSLSLMRCWAEVGWTSRNARETTVSAAARYFCELLTMSSTKAIGDQKRLNWEL